MRGGPPASSGDSCATFPPTCAARRSRPWWTSTRRRSPDRFRTGSAKAVNYGLARMSPGVAKVGRPEVEQLHRAAFHAMPDALLLIVPAADARVLDVNRAFTDLLGWPAEEVRGRPLGELRLWQDPDEPARRLAALRRVGHARWEAVELRCRDGSARVVDGWAALADQDGARLAVLGLCGRPGRDVVPASRTALEQFLECSPDAVIGVDPSGTIVLVNRHAERL